MSEDVGEIAEELAQDIEGLTSAKKRSLGSVRTADGRLAEVQLKVETDDWEWIRDEEELEQNSLNTGGNGE